VAEPTKREATFDEVAAGAELAEDKRKRVQELIEEEEGATNRLGGWLGKAVMAFAVGVSVLHLYAAAAGSPPFWRTPIIATYTLRPLHVGLVLALIFVLYPMLKRLRNRVTPLDWLCAAVSLGVVGYVLYQGPEFGDRAIDPEPLDFYVGVVLILLLLEATRRASGWIMPAVSLIFIAYALLGKYLPAPWTHRGYSIERLVGHLYMTLEGIFGTTVEVSSSLIILFTIFGAILQYSGAGKSSSTSRSRPWAASAMPRAAPSCCRRSCWAGPRARAWPRRSRSARSPIRCWRKPATRRTPRAACSRPAVLAPSSRRQSSARPLS
jgi:TRAP-type uncharacterized transport system fused permease subunit